MNDESWNDLAERHADELARLAAKSDEEIDFSDIPEQNPEDWHGAIRGWFYRPHEGQAAVPVDLDVIAWFRRHHPGDAPAAMNAALRAYVDAHDTGDEPGEDAGPDLRKTG